MTERRRNPYAGHAVPAGGGHSPAHRPWHVRRRRRRGPACCTPALCAARLPGPASTASTPRPRSRCRACMRCSSPSDLNPDVRRPGTRSRARTSPTRRARRWPRARRSSSAIRSRWSSPRRRYIAEDAVELVDVDYEPLPAVADFTTAVRLRRVRVVVHEAYPDNVAGGMGGAPPDEETVLLGRARRVRDTSTSRSYAPVPIETRGIVVEWEAASRRADDVGVHARPRTSCARSPPGCSASPAQHVRVIMRDTGGGFGQKVVPDARGHVHHAGRPQGPRAR